MVVSLLSCVLHVARLSRLVWRAQEAVLRQGAVRASGDVVNRCCAVSAGFGDQCCTRDGNRLGLGRRRKDHLEPTPQFVPWGRGPGA